MNWIKEIVNDRYRLSLFLLGAVYLVGFVTVFAGYDTELMTLTPYNLLFVLLLMLFNARETNAAYTAWFIITGTAGFFLEVIGTSTGLIFGEYTYGKTLGIKLFETPLMIGANWSFLVFATAALVYRFRLSIWLKAAIAASLMVVYDIFLEPVAIRYDLWTWAGGDIPLQNYLAWWIISYALLLGCLYFVKPLENRFAKWALGVQVLFFIVLWII